MSEIIDVKSPTTTVIYWSQTRECQGILGVPEQPSSYGFSVPLYYYRGDTCSLMNVR